MNPTMRIPVVLGLAWAIGTSGVACAEAPKPPVEGVMSLHHLHMSMMNHGLAMAAEGSNLLMLSEMGMAAEFNPTTRAHGQAAERRQGSHRARAEWGGDERVA